MDKKSFFKLSCSALAGVSILLLVALIGCSGTSVRSSDKLPVEATPTSEPARTPEVDLEKAAASTPATATIASRYIAGKFYPWPDTDTSGGSGDLAAWIEHSSVHMQPSLVTLDESIALSDAIVLAEFVSAEVAARPWGRGYHGMARYTFKALEYLQGQGKSVFTVDVHLCCEAEFAEIVDAMRSAGRMIERNSIWHKNRMLLMLQQPRNTMLSDYEFAGPHVINFSNYMITSETNRAWLPATVSKSQASGSGDDQSFFTAWSADAPRGAADQTVTLGNIRQRIGNLNTAVTKYSDSSVGRDCISAQLGSERIRQASPPTVRVIEWSAESGQPAGEVFAVQQAVSPAEWGYLIAYLVGDLEDVVVSENIDDDNNDDDNNPEKLGYTVEWTFNRPVPSGIYSNYRMSTFSVEAAKSLPCGGYEGIETLEELKDLQGNTSNFQWIITVTAPADTVHEAFFDPGTYDAAYGFDQGGYGRFEPATAEGIDFAVSKLTWQDGQVSMATTGSRTLSAHAIDFICLDGETMLSLPIGSTSAVEGLSGSYSWCVTNQPWEDGDLLMARIRLAGATGASSAGAPVCLEPTATPSPNATSTATPTPTPTPSPVP